MDFMFIVILIKGFLKRKFYVMMSKFYYILLLIWKIEVLGIMIIKI